MKLALLLAALCASCTAITLAPERPRASKVQGVLALRGGGALTLPKLAIGANIATWGFYGANLWVQPNFILQQIMMAPAAMDFLTPNYAVAQYLGAFYLSQTARMAFALTKASSKSDLLGATVINSLLCLTCVDTYCTHGLRVLYARAARTGLLRAVRTGGAGQLGRGPSRTVLRRSTRTSLGATVINSLLCVWP